LVKCPICGNEATSLTMMATCIGCVSEDFKNDGEIDILESNEARCVGCNICNRSGDAWCLPNGYKVYADGTLVDNDDKVVRKGTKILTFKADMARKQKAIKEVKA